MVLQEFSRRLLDEWGDSGGQLVRGRNPWREAKRAFRPGGERQAVETVPSQGSIGRGTFRAQSRLVPGRGPRRGAIAPPWIVADPRKSSRFSADFLERCGNLAR